MTQRCFTAITTDSAKHQILHFPLLNVTLEWQYMRSVTNHFHTADQFLLCSYNPRWRPMAGLAFACRLLHSSSITQMLTLLSLQESILLKIQRQRRWVAERARRQEIFGINFFHYTRVWKQRSLLQHGTLQCFNLSENIKLELFIKGKEIFKTKLADVKWYVFCVWNNVVVNSEETKYPSFWNRAYNHIVLIKTCTLFIQVIDLLNQAQLEKENKLNCLKQVWINLVYFSYKEINMHGQTMTLRITVMPE